MDDLQEEHTTKMQEWLDSMILIDYSNQNDSIILWKHNNSWGKVGLWRNWEAKDVFYGLVMVLFGLFVVLLGLFVFLIIL